MKTIPESGGSYLRDPKTGALSKDAVAAPAAEQIAAELPAAQPDETTSEPKAAPSKKTARKG